MLRSLNLLFLKTYTFSRGTNSGDTLMVYERSVERGVSKKQLSKISRLVGRALPDLKSTW